MTDPSSLPRQPAPGRRRWLRGLLSLVLVVAIFVGVFPKIASYGDVWSTIRGMTWLEELTLLAAALWNLATYSFLLMASLPGLRFGPATATTQTSTAVSNTVPGGAALGIALSFTMFTSYGFSRAAATLSMLVSGVWNNFAKFGMPLVALAALAIVGDANRKLVVASLVGLLGLGTAIGVFAAVLVNDRFAAAAGRWLSRVVSRLRAIARRPPVADWGASALAFRGQTIGLLRRRWVALTIATLVSHLSLFLVLLLSLRHVGVSEQEVGWAEVLAAFAFVRLVSALPVTPGGLGVVELGMTAALVAAGGDRASVVAGVLLYRALTYLLPIPLGVVAYVWWTRYLRRSARAGISVPTPRTHSAHDVLDRSPVEP